MDRVKQLAINRSRRLKNAGAHLYHAATGVADGNQKNKNAMHRLKKHFARYRGKTERDTEMNKDYPG